MRFTSGTGTGAIFGFSAAEIFGFSIFPPLKNTDLMNKIYTIACKCTS